MKQKDLGLDLSTRRTRKQILLEEMDQVMPWAELLALIALHAPVAKRDRPLAILAIDLIDCFGVALDEIKDRNEKMPEALAEIGRYLVKPTKSLSSFLEAKNDDEA